MDFGLAKLISHGDTSEAGTDGVEKSLSAVGVIKGTPSYMSPEQIRGDEVDIRSDIFSFGVVLYEMSTGQKAFGGNTGGVIIEAILGRTPPPARALNPEIPAELEAIINKAIEKDKRSRYQLAEEIRADLQALRHGLKSGQLAKQLLATADGRRLIWSKSIKRAIFAAIAAVAALALGGGLRYGKKGHVLGESDTIVLADFTNGTGDPVFDSTLRQGLAIQLGQSPYLSLVSDERIQETLLAMNRREDAKLTPAMARISASGSAARPTSKARSRASEAITQFSCGR